MFVIKYIKLIENGRIHVKVCFQIAGRIIDRNYKKYGGDISAVAKINSDIFNPVYEHKEEFREPDPPVSATLLLKVTLFPHSFRHGYRK